MLEDAVYQKVTKIIFPRALQYVVSKDDAEDIVQQVLMKLCINENRISHKSIVSWALTVTHNECINLLRAQKRTNDLKFYDLNNTIYDKLAEEKVKPDFKDMLDEVGRLTSKEKKLLIAFQKSGLDLRKVARQKKEGYDKIRKRLYRLKISVQAEYNVQKGMIGSKAIISSNFHESILYFIRRLDNCIRHNELSKMKRYFGREISKDDIPDIKISKLIKYDVKMLGEKKYFIGVSYQDDSNNFNFFYLEILNPGNRRPIEITKIPKLPLKRRGYRKVDISKNDIKDLFAVSKTKGTLLLNQEEREKILSKYTPFKVMKSI